MSLGTWDPSGAGASAGTIDQQQLQRYAELARGDALLALEQHLDSADVQAIASLMALEPQDWADTLASFENAALLDLIRFFTLAENLPGCEAGDKSPVIPMARLVRKRGTKLDRDLLMWIREHNNNRFLPYGPL